MVLLNGEPLYSQLAQYPTLAQCQVAQAYVEAAMHESYPDDQDLRVYCKPRGTQARHKNRQRKGRWSNVPLTKEMI
jgi:hypothetical protein